MASLWNVSPKLAEAIVSSNAMFRDRTFGLFQWLICRWTHNFSSYWNVMKTWHIVAYLYGSRDWPNWTSVVMTKGQTEICTEKLESDGLGCVMEKTQHSGSSVCLLYAVEYGGRVMAYSWMRNQSCYIWINKETGLLCTVEQGGNLSYSQWEQYL